MSNLGTLVVRLVAEIAGYKAGMKEAVTTTEEAAQKIETSSKRASDSATKLMESLEKQVKTYGMSAAEMRRYEAAQADLQPKQREAVASHLAQLEAMERQTARQKELSSSAYSMGLAIAAAATTAAVGVGVMVKGAIDNADAVGKMAATTGIATETLSAYQHAASLSDVSNETLAVGLKTLSKNIAEGSEVLGRMGIATKDSQGNLRSMDAVMGEVADKFTGYKDGAGKAALAQELFGKSGMSMINMLNDGSAGLASMRAEAQELGLVIDGQTAAAAAEFNDNLTRLHARSQGYATSLAAQLLPALTAVTESFMEGGKNSGFMRSAVDVLAAGLKGLISVGYGVASVFEQIGTWFGGIAAAAAAVLRGDFGQVKSIFADMTKDMSDKAAASGARINQVWSAIGDGAKKAGSEMDKADAPGKVEKTGKAAKTALTEVERLAAAGEKLAASLVAQESGLSGDFAQKWLQLSEAYKAGRISLDLLVQAQAQLLSTQPAMVAAHKAELVAAEQLAKATLAAAQAHESQVQSLSAGLAQLEQEVQRQREHNEELGLSKLALVDLQAARLQDQAATLEGLAIKALDRNGDQQQYELYMAQARALRELAALKLQGGVKEAAIEGAKDATAAWDKSAGQIEQSLTDALMNGFSRGKDFARSLVDGVKAMVNTMVLRPMVSAVATPVAGALGFAGPASAGGGAAGSAADGLGMLGNVASLFGAGGMAGSLAAGAGWLTGATTLGGSLSAGASLIGTGSLAGGLSGAGMIVGALAPIGIAIAGIYMLAKKLDHSGTPHIGGGAQYSSVMGLQTTAGSTFDGGFTGVGASASTIEFTSGVVKSVVGILDSTAVAFGKSAGYQAASSFADDSSKDGAWGSLVITKLGDKIVDWADTQSSKWAPKVFSDGTAGNNEYLAAVSADVLGALKAIDLPGWAADALAALGDAPALDELAQVVQQINVTQAALAGMGKTLVGFADLSDGAVRALMAASGGIEVLAANASSYYQNFYSEEERLANTRRLTFEALSGAGVDTAKLTDRDAYRSYVEYLQSIVDTEPAAAGALAAMLNLNDEFASFVPAVDAVGDAVTRTAADIAASLNSLQGETASLQVELLRAKGDEAGAATLQRALDIAGFTDAEVAVYDLNASLRAQVAAENAAAAAAQERTGIENTLLQALGETATLRQRELDALDPGNRALQAMVYAVQDAQGAISSLTSDIARLDAIATQAADLSNSISVALGGADNTEAGLWATINDASASAEDRLGAVGKMIGIINASIATDTSETQRLLTQGAQQAQQAVEDANKAQKAGYTSQLEAAQKMVDLGKQLRDYVAGLLVGNLSALTPEQKLAQARQDYERALAGARAGDETAQAQLTGKASTYLEQARGFDAEGYRGVFAEVTGALGSFGGSLMTEGEQAQATAQAQLDQLNSISGAAGVAASAALAGNVISDANRTTLETLLGLTTQIEADAVIERADKQAQLTAETERMEAIRQSLADDGVIASSVLSSSTVLSDFATRQQQDNATLTAEVRSLNARIVQLEATLVSAAGAQMQTDVTVGAQVAQAVAQAVTTALARAAGKPELA